MDIYLVGGAVRDELLGLAVGERDWVVVGADPQQLIDMGYKPVGRDFPVFLHPETREEYALARTERKTAPGYHGFEFHAAPDVTLEQDLQRRDITINAMARDVDGNLIDPFGGQRDLEKRVIRHVSDAFTEDPVRILRVARFACRFHEQGFTIAGETRALMVEMVDAGEVDALVAERVWAETVRAMAEKKPSVYFEILRDCGALNVLFPEIDRLWGVPQPARWHPEIDTGVHTMMVLDQSAKLTNDVAVRFAALVHDLGKGTTPAEVLPSHHGHEERSVGLVHKFCDRYRVPNRYRELAVHVARYHGHYHKISEMRPDTIVTMLGKLDAFRQPERFEQFLLACEADSRGRTGYEDRRPPQSEIFRACLAAASRVDSKSLVRDGMSGEQIRAAIFQARTDAVAGVDRQTDERAG